MFQHSQPTFYSDVRRVVGSAACTPRTHAVAVLTANVQQQAAVFIRFIML